mmetsp:Transcript_210/g.487  ORF Transcript_210/g.487 Transcript_210/m.487 type:complete len:230 (+) Transcript_210:409-1098(+)
MQRPHARSRWTLALGESSQHTAHGQAIPTAHSSPPCAPAAAPTARTPPAFAPLALWGVPALAVATLPRGGCTLGGGSPTALLPPPTPRLHGRELLLGQREGHLLAGLVEDKWHPFRVVDKLVHDGAIAEPLHVFLESMHTGWRHLRHLLRVQSREALAHVDAMEETNKTFACLRCAEVDETVAHVALVLEVNGQVNKIKLAFMLGIQLLDEHVPCVLVGDVPQHHRSVD